MKQCQSSIHGVVVYDLNHLEDSNDCIYETPNDSMDDPSHSNYEIPTHSKYGGSKS